MPHVRIDHLEHRYRSRGGTAVESLGDVSLEVDDGEFVAIVGPSGCGKTTLLKLVAGLLLPTHGSITIGNESPITARDQAKISLMFQSANLLPWRTVSENISLPRELAGVKDGSEIESLVRLVKLDGFGNRFPRELSGGMLSRVALARSIALSPSLLMLDEPFGSLDEETSRDLNLEILSIWRKTRATILLVTHNIDHAVFVAQRVVVMSNRPACIKATIPIDLPEPRDSDTRFTQAYFDGITRVRHALENTHEQH